MIDIFAPGGGFVFAQVHNIQPLVPVENILAMFETVKRRRSYERG
jgi:uroporphyrinogen decarboxylase